MFYEVFSATLIFIQDRIKPSTKSLYLLKTAQMLQIKLNTLETFPNCRRPLRVQSLYREHKICEVEVLAFMSSNIIPL